MILLRSLTVWMILSVMMRRQLECFGYLLELLDLQHYTLFSNNINLSKPTVHPPAKHHTFSRANTGGQSTEKGGKRKAAR